MHKELMNNYFCMGNENFLKNVMTEKDVKFIREWYYTHTQSKDSKMRAHQTSATLLLLENFFIWLEGVSLRLSQLFRTSGGGGGKSTLNFPVVTHSLQLSASCVLHYIAKGSILHHRRPSPKPHA